MTLQEIVRRTLQEGAQVNAVVACQVVSIRENATKGGKPFLDLEVSDGTAKERFKIWQDSPAYEFAEELRDGECVRLEASFFRNQFGLNVDRLHLRMLQAQEVTDLFAGTPERRALLQRDFDYISGQVAGMADPRLRVVGQQFLAQFGDRFRRAAAARFMHHARRGGLLEHTAQMMRAAAGLETAYTHLNWDIVKSGVLFHDCGKIWEMDYAPEGFVSPLTTMGEMLGHIVLGIQAVSKLWRACEAQPDFMQAGAPSRDQVRDHLLHMIASHHGTREFGAVVTPRTPEAWMLHYIDNIDAKYEMMQATYSEKGQVAPGIYDFRRPMEERAIAPLPKWPRETDATTPTAEGGLEPLEAIEEPASTEGEIFPLEEVGLELEEPGSRSGRAG